MTTTLRAVLEAFQVAEAPLSLGQLAATLDVSPPLLEGMIEYWVRKGRLREAGTAGSACAACHQGRACPLIVKMPRRYELAAPGERAPEPPPPCGCCHS